MSDDKTIRTVGVVGCGLMGSGIAQVAALGGYQVRMCDADHAALDRGVKRIQGSLAKFVEKEKLTSEARDAAIESLTPTTDLADLADCDLVIEAIIEDLEQKKALFQRLGSMLAEGAILATNTSSLSVTEMGAASGRPDCMVGLHFFNPVPLMKLVEVVRTEATSDDSFDRATQFGKRVGKVAVAAIDSPGFIVNRLLVPFLIEAIRMAERGDATIEDIDTGMQLGCGHPMGPITLLDYVGLDTTLFIIEGWHARNPDNPAFEPPTLLKKLVAEGRLGRKSGHGFYEWDGDKRR